MLGQENSENIISDLNSACTQARDLADTKNIRVFVVRDDKHPENHKVLLSEHAMKVGETIICVFYPIVVEKEEPKELPMYSQTPAEIREEQAQADRGEIGGELAKKSPGKKSRPRY